MVFDGTPSKGCQVCRKRKVKCDGTRPHCLRCIRTGRECHGYRDPFDVVFRDEGAAVKRRIQNANAGGSKPKDAAEPRAQVNLNSRRRQAAAAAARTNPTSALVQPVGERARCHFVSNFIYIRQPDVTEQGYNQFYMGMLRREQGTIFNLAVEACSLASLSVRVADGGRLQAQAIMTYGKTLPALSAAMEDPATAQSDEVLAAVMLCALFENLVPSQQAFAQWAKHVGAAVRLVHLRGSEQFKTELGKRMFINVKILASRLAGITCSPMPLGVDFWIRGASQDKFTGIISNKAVECVDLRARIDSALKSLPRSSPESTQAVSALIDECKLLDQQLVDWCSMVPDYYKPRIATTIPEAGPDQDFEKMEAYPGPVYAFEDFTASSMTISAWSHRLILLSQIVRCAAWIHHPGDYHETQDYQDTARATAKLLPEVASALPYQLGWFNSRKDLLGSQQLPTFACGQDDHPKGLAGEVSSWMLVSILINDAAKESQREWARGRLRYVYKTHGLHQAQAQSGLTLREPSLSIAMDAAGLWPKQS